MFSHLLEIECTKLGTAGTRTGWYHFYTAKITLTGSENFTVHSPHHEGITAYLNLRRCCLKPGEVETEQGWPINQVLCP